MRVGSLEIQIMAGIARLQKDMNDAQRIVGSSMGQVERSVASAKRAMQALGVGIPVAMITDQVRRMSDQYTKLDAQLRLATKSQQQYAQGMSDVRRISTIAQSDISATSMLYTRLMNVMDGTGVSQAKLATVTETVTFGLKAYGATSAEAASAALQLSQAMGANRLGGEEFRAVMEAMPNVMKVLANSMGVPLGELRALSIAGKITAEEMVKAFGDPAIAEQFKQLALRAQTITGAWTVARNEFMLLIGEFMKSSGATSGIIAGFNAVGTVLRVMVDNLTLITNAILAYVTVLTGKLVVGLIQARMAQMALNAANAETAASNVAMAEAAVFGARANLAGAAAAVRAGGSMVVASAAAKEYTSSLATLATAEKAQAASSISIMGRVKGLMGRAGWIGMALFGAWTVYDFLNGMQQVADGAKNLNDQLAGMTLQQAELARQKELLNLIGLRNSVLSKFNEREIRASEDRLRQYDMQLSKMYAVANAEYAAGQAKKDDIALTHDQMVTLTAYNALLEQKEKYGMKEAEFAKKVRELYLGKKFISPAELQAKNDRDVLDAATEYWSKVDQKRIDDQLKAEQDALEKRQKEHQDFWDSIDKTAHDTFVSIMDGSKDAATRLRDMFKNIFFDWLYQMTIKKWLIGVSASFAPTAASAASSMAGTGGMGAAGFGFGTAAGAVGSALGAGLGLGMGASAGAAGAYASAGMYSQAIGFGAAAAAPVVAALLIAKYGFGLGNSAERVGDARLSGSFSRGGFTGGTEQDWMKDGGLFGNTSRWTVTTALTTAQHKAFKATVDGLQSTFNTLGNAIGDTGLKTREWTVNVNQAGDVTGILTDGMGAQLVPALRDLRLEGETLANTAVRLTSVFKSTGDFIAALSLSSMQAFGAEGVLSAKQRADLVAATGGDQAFSQLVGTFMSAILTPAEQLQTSLNTVGRTFAQLGIVGVETNAQFAELVRDALGRGDYSTVGALLSVSDAFSQITKSAANTTTAMSDAAKAAQDTADKLKGLVNQNNFSTFVDYQRMMASIQAGVPAQAALDMPNTVGTGVIAGATAAAGGTLAQEQVAADTARKQAAAVARAARIEAKRVALEYLTTLANQPVFVGDGYIALAEAAHNKRNGPIDMSGDAAYDWNTPSYNAYWAALATYESLPAFASGGVHSGGMRIVGENGPEIEYTGPSAITSNSDSRKMLDNSGVIASVDALRSELRAVGVAVAASTQKTTKILDRWDGQGMPETRVL